jgi:hypothetical protein
MTVNIRSTTSFGGEVKALVTCGKILRHVKDLYSHEKINLAGKIQSFLAEFILFRY